MIPINRTLRIATAFALVSALAGAAGCSRRLDLTPVPNQPPWVEITEAPRDSTVSCTPDPVQSCYAIDIRWTGYDPDGEVDYYRIAVDPPAGPGADTVWTRTRANRHHVVLRSTQQLPRDPYGIPYARDFHVIVVQAVDNQGLVGPADTRAFFSYTQAPDVVITSPAPTGFTPITLTPSLRISWRGEDADGAHSGRPVAYKYLLLTSSSGYPLLEAVRDPDAFARHFAPGFAGWDSVGGDVTSAQYTGLTPDQEYLFVVVAFDEAGAYSPIFTLNTNMLRFRVGLAAFLGPRITAWSEFFDYTWRTGNCPCREAEYPIEMPAGHTLRVDWRATPPTGANIRGYRWALDIDDVRDETRRTDPSDLSHWSPLALSGTSMTLGPFAGNAEVPEEHRLYIEAHDDVGLKSLAIILIRVVPANFTPGSVLIVKDARLRLDNLDRSVNPPCAARPLGPWPTSAELDTFLFARGGFRWRCYPTGTVSSPGIFAGYRFDTLGTRTRRADLTVPLATLARYQHVIWIVDQNGANFSGDGTDPVSPMPALRYMSGPGRFNSLTAYVRLGGKVWLVGGGGGFASTIPWNVRSNDQPTITFASPGELGAGRLMFDVARWRSEFRASREPATVRRFAGRHEVRSSPDLPYTRHLGELPPRLELRTSASDPLPPLRTNRGDFYHSVVSLEYLQLENEVVADLDPDPEVDRPAALLDTLYEATGGGMPTPDENPHNVVMTYAHGPDLPQGFLYTGFDLWTFKRSQCKAVVDFVMRRVWNLGPAAAVRAAHPESGEERRRRPPGLSRPPGLDGPEAARRAPRRAEPPASR